MMTELAHERLDAYKASIDFLAIADEVSGSLPKGRAYLADQLRRAATSIALNIAEGAGEFAAREKGSFVPDGAAIGDGMWRGAGCLRSPGAWRCGPEIGFGQGVGAPNRVDADGARQTAGGS
jgi:hypothetical protein